MSKTTLLLTISVVTAFIGCVVFAYLWIDRSISLSYMQQSYETERSSVESLQKLIASEWKGMPEAQVQKKLEQVAAQMPERAVVVKKEDESIWFDQVTFNIKQGKLDSVGKAAR
jgi:ABC-type multidrug transport system fused ATPase/permease subunit